MDRRAWQTMTPLPVVIKSWTQLSMHAHMCSLLHPQLGSLLSAQFLGSLMSYFFLSEGIVCVWELLRINPEAAFPATQRVRSYSVASEGGLGTGALGNENHVSLTRHTWNG